MNIKSFKDGVRAMNVELQTKAGLRATAAGSHVVKKRAKAIAEAKGLRDSGALIDNIAIVRKPLSGLGTYFRYELGVRHGGKKQKKSGRDPWYWWLWEFGWTDKAGGRHKREFIRPALAESAPQYYEAVKRSLQNSLKRFLKSTA